MKLLRNRVYCCAFVALVATIVSGIGHAEGTGTWQTKAPLPIGRYGSPAAVIDGKLFVASGCCQNPFDRFPLRFSDVRVYDPAQDSWSTRAPMPTPLSNAPNGVIDGKWYVAGGQPCCQNIATLQIYDPLLDHWTTGPPMPDPSGGGAGGVINGELFVAGGMDAADIFPVATLRVFNPIANAWHSGPSMPAARANGAGAVVDGRLYFVGGGDASALHNELYIYDPAVNAWTTGPSMPTPRYLLGAAAFDGKFYAFGGTDNVTPLDTVEVFDPVTNMWSVAPSMPEPHVLPSAGVIGNALYVVGGSNALGPVGSTNNVFVLAPPRVTPSITVFGGTFTYSGFSHPATAGALDAGNPVPGFFSFAYTPGGANAPITPGTYQVDATFTPQDPN